MSDTAAECRPAELGKGGEGLESLREGCHRTGQNDSPACLASMGSKHQALWQGNGSAPPACQPVNQVGKVQEMYGFVSAWQTAMLH